MRKILVCAPLFCGPELGLFAAGTDDLSLAPRPGVLLLKNGELIAGTITAAGDRYDIQLPDAEISIRRAEVAASCHSLDECYAVKSGAIDETRVQDHLELAEWCLKNGLLEAAEKELTVARTLDARHPKITLVERRLALAREQPKEAEPAVLKAGPGEQLDAMVRGLPDGCRAKFHQYGSAADAQPLRKGGCHGTRTAGSLRLERIAPNRLAGRSSTQRNLLAVLAMIDREKPEASKLLAAPIRPHGSLKSPVFSDRDQIQYKQLVEWVYLVAAAREAATRPTLEERSAPLLQNIKGRQQPPFEQILPASATMPATPNKPQPDGESPQGQVDQNADQGATPPAVLPSGTANDPQESYRLTRVHGQLVMRPARATRRERDLHAERSVRPGNLQSTVFRASGQAVVRD